MINLRRAAAVAAAALGLALGALAAPASASIADPEVRAGAPANAAVPLACTSDAEIIYSVNIHDNSGGLVIGNLQLKYSPSCRVAWGRVVSYLNSTSTHAVVRSSAGGVASCNGGGEGTGCNTPMINDAGPITSFAQGTIFNTAGNSVIGQATTPSF